mmetsp:Transcript_34696/g.79505  ORF Transcript_34696/g.79505 Transcript_34696/m.79505 type:complete len:453 (-) Transcript_34696:130-1488(-)
MHPSRGVSRQACVRRVTLCILAFQGLALWVQHKNLDCFVCAGPQRPIKQVSAGRGLSRHHNLSRCPLYAAGHVEALVKHPRLPVWPVWLGLVYTVFDLLFKNFRLSAELEDRLGGRVCPMLFEQSRQTDPFLLMAHHRHSFSPLDPVRYLFRAVFMPEGFPAHPHRGFETVTYVLKGGLVHRDSFGVKKSYGENGDGAAAVQWMTAGQGILHEEMWRTGSWLETTDQELFQIWVNLPASQKMVPPRMQMLGESPTRSSDVAAASSEADAWAPAGVEVRELGPIPESQPTAGVRVRVVSGSVDGVTSPVQTYSPVTILHVTLERGTTWDWCQPVGWTCVVYARKGEVRVGHAGKGDDLIPLHHTATLEPGEGSEVSFTAAEDGADLILLAGEPLLEPVASGANIVMNTGAELREADYDMRSGFFGPVWEHTEDDESWQNLVKRHWAAMAAPRQ